MAHASACVVWLTHSGKFITIAELKSGKQQPRKVCTARLANVYVWYSNKDLATQLFPKQCAAPPNCSHPCWCFLLPNFRDHRTRFVPFGHGALCHAIICCSVALFSSFIPCHSFCFVKFTASILLFSLYPFLYRITVRYIQHLVAILISIEPVVLYSARFTVGNIHECHSFNNNIVHHREIHSDMPSVQVCDRRNKYSLFLVSRKFFCRLYSVVLAANILCNRESRGETQLPSRKIDIVLCMKWDKIQKVHPISVVECFNSSMACIIKFFV